MSRSRSKPQPAYTPAVAIRTAIEAIGTLKQCDPYHWQVRRDGKFVADWWPHTQRFLIVGEAKSNRGTDGEFVTALQNYLGRTVDHNRLMDTMDDMLEAMEEARRKLQAGMSTENAEIRFMEHRAAYFVLKHAINRATAH